MRRSLLLAALLVAAPTTVALADSAAPPAPPPPAPGIVPAGKVNLALTLELEMTTDKVANPLSFAPDVAYGATRDLTVALVHSSFAISGFRARTGNGLCVSGTDHGCVAVYNNLGVEGWYNLARGSLAGAAVLGAHALNLDAGFYVVKLGFKARHTTGKLAVITLPSVLLAITEREDDQGNPRNKDTLWVPVQLTYRALDALTVGVGSGLKGPLSGFGDGWQVPLGVMAQYAVDKQLTVGASWVFGQLLGGADDPPDPAPAATGLRYRGAQVWASYTL